MNPAISNPLSDAVLAALKLAIDLRAIAQQTREWTPEAEKAYREMTEKLFTEPHWLK